MDVLVHESSFRIAHVEITGRLDALSAQVLQARLDALTDAEESPTVTRLLIDLTALDFLDSAGLAVLVRTLKHVRRPGPDLKADLKLVWPEAEVARRILRLTRFDAVFELFDSAEAALLAFDMQATR